MSDLIHFLFNPVNGWFWKFGFWVFVLFSIFVLIAFVRLVEPKNNRSGERTNLNVPFICYVFLVDLIVIIGVWVVLKNNDEYSTNLDAFLILHGSDAITALLFLVGLNFSGIFASLNLTKEKNPKIQNYFVSASTLKETKTSDGKVSGFVYVYEILKPNHKLEIKTFELAENGLKSLNFTIGYQFTKEGGVYFNTDLGFFPSGISEGETYCVVNYTGMGKVEFHNIPETSKYLITVAHL